MISSDAKNKISQILLYCMFAIFIIITFMAVYPVKVYEQNYDKLPVLTSQVVAGEELRYTIDYCKYKPISGTVDKWLVNGEIINFPTVTSNQDAGCHKTNVALKIPKYTCKGIANLNILLRYKVNFFRTQEYLMRTEDFEII